MDPQTLPTLRVPNEHLSPFLPGQSRFRATFARTVKVTLKTTLTSSQNRHPRRNARLRRVFPGWRCRIFPTPLRVLAPHERRGEDQNPFEQPAQCFSSCDRALHYPP